MSSSQTSYPAIIARCQHIKVNGTQCGCPALRDRRLCFFHYKWQEATNAGNARAERRRAGEPPVFFLPILEDANSVQVSLMEVMRMLLDREIDHKTAALLLYALQTAASNLHHTNFDPRPEQVLTESGQLATSVIGGDAWSTKKLAARLKKDAAKKAAESAPQPNAAAAKKSPRKLNGEGAAIDLKASAAWTRGLTHTHESAPS
jgi:hypothetical protein